MTFNFLNAVPKLITLAITSIVLIGCGGESAKQQQKIPQAEIQVTEVTVQNVPLTKTFVGQVYGTKDIPIRSRVEGFLEGIHFREGSRVKKGQLLYTVDPQSYSAEVTMRKSQLAEAKVSLIRASNDLDRIQPLAEQNAVSKSDLDAALAEKGAAESMVAAAQANLRMSQIELGYTTIESPITGVIGRTEAKVGEFVGREPNPVILNTVSRIDSVNVRFFITENDYLRLARYAMTREKSGQKRTEKEERESEKLELIFSDNTIYSQKGHIDFLDRNVDANTGAMLIQATFPNNDRLIRPGQFAKVRSVIDIVKDGILIPQRCVMEFQGRHTVYVVDNNGLVSQRKIELSSTYKDYWLVRSGLKKGEKIVLEGLQKVREGATVKFKTVKFESQYEAQ
ncbi:efflux RND transporter periplasmic adaptor subunit [Flammeovirga kamogawensis]|uniref:Efflux RND transporter periplasmic adaptor subunit n=1 Tax=Flammeovirga kamogawensis TaxID=373891 RepID=A0ABX8GR48_9BACT|nr:efflux RND transporter periplasmic adaptor subunit [Flammeovirga kamogawensis]MBB6462048.1 membrane fusion protein (multidrug efflux system) [Flammeovirga kamogawensis]QWG05783.1 efflux RND transporter periplasmic adaptor subunit [Flammeovirga kamogawensis]TRX67610.1 efflux RND transporter periplasmic adaptor subunit [Flammeovirga kamogawensis]